ncbi:MAG: branched-chain amino acid ABC transporter permease, partial [Nitriliruptor sp.]
MAGTIVRPSAAPAPSTDPSGPTAKAAVWRPSPRGIIARVLVLATAIGLVLLLPLVVPATDVNVVSRVTVFAMVALSLNVLVGYTGQVSLGHAAFLGFGAFGSGYALTELGLPWLVAAGVAVLIGAIVAVLLGGVALRIQGLYLALVTLAFGLFSEQVVFSIPAVTGGG